MYVSLVLTSDSQSKGSNAVEDEETMRLGDGLGLVLCVPPVL